MWMRLISLNSSESSPSGITFTGHYNDLVDVIAWARGQDWFMSPFALAGQSMGAASVLLYAENYPDDVDLLLLISFPWLSGQSKIIQDNDPQKLRDWKETGYWDKVSKSRGRTLRMPYGFMEDLCRQDLAANAANITAKTILMIGDQENKRRLVDNQKLLDLLECEKTFILLPNMPHVVAKAPENAKTYREALIRVLDA